MYVLRVQINDESPVVGGMEDLGVLSAIVTGVGKLGPASHPSRPDETAEFHLRLGGLTSRAPGQRDEHVEWVSHRELRVGDKVVVELLDSEVADPVVSGKEAEERAQDERAYFEHCRRVYMDLKAKYEPEG